MHPIYAMLITTFITSNVDCEIQNYTVNSYYNHIPITKNKAVIIYQDKQEILNINVDWSRKWNNPLPYIKSITSRS